MRVGPLVLGGQRCSGPPGVADSMHYEAFVLCLMASAVYGNSVAGLGY